MRKCLFCQSEISRESVIDFCEQCGNRVWGPKMLKAIVEQMTSARERGDLHQGLVSSAS